jgi:hypothetical protein
MAWLRGLIVQVPVPKFMITLNDDLTYRTAFFIVTSRNEGDSHPLYPHTNQEKN